MRSTTVASKTLAPTRTTALAATKLSQKAAPVEARKPISRAVKAVGPKEGLLNHTPKAILHRYPLRSRGIGNSLTNKTVKATLAVKGLSKAPAVDLKGMPKATLPGANLAQNTQAGEYAIGSSVKNLLFTKPAN